MRFRTPFRRGITRFLPYFYSLPVDVSVHVVRQKGGKADNDGNVSRIRQTCQHPQNNQHDVVRGIRQRKRRTAPERQINRQKTLAKYACVGGGPKFRKFGTMRVIYKIEDLDEWIERRLSKTFSSTGIPCGGDDA